MKYKINANIVVDEMDDCLILTKENKNKEIDYNHAIVLEDVGKFIFSLLMKNKDDKFIVNQVVKEYDVQSDVAKKDFENFINQLYKAGIIYDGQSKN